MYIRHQRGHERKALLSSGSHSCCHMITCASGDIWTCAHKVVQYSTSQTVLPPWLSDKTHLRLHGSFLHITNAFLLAYRIGAFVQIQMVQVIHSYTTHPKYQMILQHKAVLQYPKTAMFHLWCVCAKLYHAWGSAHLLDLIVDAPLHSPLICCAHLHCLPQACWWLALNYFSHW